MEEREQAKGDLGGEGVEFVGRGRHIYVCDGHMLDRWFLLIWDFEILRAHAAGNAFWTTNQFWIRISEAT